MKSKETHGGQQNPTQKVCAKTAYIHTGMEFRK